MISFKTQTCALIIPTSSDGVSKNVQPFFVVVDVQLCLLKLLNLSMEIIWSDK